MSKSTASCPEGDGMHYSRFPDVYHQGRPRNTRSCQRGTMSNPGWKRLTTPRTHPVPRSPDLVVFIFPSSSPWRLVSLSQWNGCNYKRTHYSLQVITFYDKPAAVKKIGPLIGQIEKSSQLLPMSYVIHVLRMLLALNTRDHGIPRELP